MTGRVPGSNSVGRRLIHAGRQDHSRSATVTTNQSTAVRPFDANAAHAAALAEATRLIPLARALAHGTAPFNVLSRNERSEQLARLGLALDLQQDAEDLAMLRGIRRAKGPADAKVRALMHLISMEGEPSNAEKAAIYEVEETIDRELTREEGEDVGDRWDGLG